MAIINRIFNHNFIKNEKRFFEKYVWSSLLLNALLIPLTGIYELGLTHSIYGQIVGIVFLLTFFWNLGLIYLNEKYIDKTKIKERRLHLLTYGYLIFAIFSVITLIVSSNVGGIRRHVFNPMYYFVWIYGFAISYFDYTILISKHRIKYEDPILVRRNENALKIIMIVLILLTVIFTGIFVSKFLTSAPTLSPFLLLIYIFYILLIPILLIFFPILGILLFKYKWKNSQVSLTIKGLLKVILLSLSLLTFILAGFIAFNMLTGMGRPLIIFFVINILLHFFFPSLILLIPIITVLIYKLIPQKWEKISKSLTFIGFFLTISFALPYLAAPVSIVDADNQFADVFGRNWNDFHPAVDEEFLDMQHVLIQSWFGEPELDPDSWRLDSNHVYKKTDDYKLKFDVYYPGPTGAQFIGEKATIIFIHGGAWSGGHRNSGAKYLKYFAAQGYIGFSISYRLLELDSSDRSYVGDYNIEDMMEDIANFTRYLAANEDEDVVHGADLDNVFLIGRSAGAHLAGVTGFGYNDDEWGLDQKLDIKGIVLFYPPNSARRYFYEDFPFYYEHGYTKYKTPEDDPDFYDLYTPSKLVDDDDPPCLIIQGTSDIFVPYENAEEIKKACDKNDVDVILISNYFMGHGHDTSYLFYSMSIYYMERFFYLIKED